MSQVKRVIVPIDFTVKSLSVVKELIESSEQDTFFEIILLHGVYPSDSISDLLFRKPSFYIKKLETAEFNAACEMIKNKFQSKLKALYIDIISSDNKNYFKNYMAKNNIDEIVMPKGIQLNFKNKYSFNLVAFLEKSKLPLKYIQLESVEYSLNKADNVSDLFIGNGNSELQHS